MKCIKVKLNFFLNLIFLKGSLSTKRDQTNKFLHSASTPLAPSTKYKTNMLDIFSPINKEVFNIDIDGKIINTIDEVDNTDAISYSINDISTWIGGKCLNKLVF